MSDQTPPHAGASTPAVQAGAAPSAESAAPFGLTDVKPHHCRLPRGWRDILDGRARYWIPPYDPAYNPAYNRAYNPAEFVDYPERLPDDWRDACPDGISLAGDALSCQRLYRDILRSVDLIGDALQTAGWGLEEAVHLLRYADIRGHVTRLGEQAWNFRRYGFSVTETTAWLSHVDNPSVARVYADMGYQPREAARLITWAGEHFPVRRRADAQAAILCFRASRRRTRDYIRAGISHEEIHYWERQRRRLDPAARLEQDRTLALMAALSGDSGSLA